MPKVNTPPTAEPIIEPANLNKNKRYYFAEKSDPVDMMFAQVINNSIYNFELKRLDKGKY